MFNKYKSLDSEIRRAGFFTNGVEPKGDWDRTTVCSIRLPGGIGYGGNSFWVTLLSDGWYVGAWGGWIYRIPDADRVASFCIKWLTREPNEVRADFDADIKLEFGLVVVSDDEFNDIAGETVEHD